MKILALDQATKTGWAVGDETSLERRAIEFGVFKMPKRDVLGDRLMIFRSTLNEIIDHYQPELIAYERPYWPQPGAPRGFVAIGKVIARLRSGSSAGSIIGWLNAVEAEEGGPPKISADTLQFLQKVEGLVITTATERHLPYEGYASQSWRKTAVGYGHAPPGAEDEHMKKAMMAKAKLLGYKPDSYDESDAIGILIHALHGPPGSARAQGDLLKMAEASL